MLTKPRYWSGTVGPIDDFGRPITQHFVDGATRLGPWAKMSMASYCVHGIGLGTGKGQLYQRQDDGRWLKVEG